MTYFHCARLRQRVGLLSAIAATAVASCLPLLSGAAQPGHEVIGKWRFVAALDFTEPAALDEKQARLLLGRVMTIRTDGVRFNGKYCGPPDFRAKRVEPNLYSQQESGISAKKLRLPNPVTVVDISCTQALVRNPDRLVIFWEGWYFEAARAGR